VVHTGISADELIKILISAHLNELNQVEMNRFVRFFTPKKVARSALTLITIVFLLLSTPGAAHAQASNIHQTVRLAKPELQNGRIETFTITIPQLGDRQKNIQVYLPPDYDTGDKLYPVIYLGDGEYLFNPPSTTLGDYRIDEILDSLFEQGILDGMIVVGIEHDLNYQWDEYTPWINPNMHEWVKTSNSEPAEGGEGFAYIDFIANTLKPEIDARYRTLTDRENTLIGGFCRNALIPLLGGLIYPAVFSRVMSMSPAVWLAEGGGTWLSNNQLISFINSMDVPKDVRFYIHIGTEESSGPRPPVKDSDGNRITYPRAYVEGAQAVYSALLNNGVPEPNLYFELEEGSSGKRDDWGDRFDFALLWLLEDIRQSVAEPSPETPITPEPVEPSEPVENLEPVIQPTQTPESDPWLILPGFPNFQLHRNYIIGILLGGFLLIPAAGVIVWLLRKR